METRVMKIGKDVKPVDIDYTTTKVFLYSKGELIGRAGVQDPKDFNYERLVKFAAQGVGKLLDED